MNPFFYSEEAGAKGCPFPCTPSLRSTQAFAPLRTFSVDDAEHFSTVNRGMLTICTCTTEPVSDSTVAPSNRDR
jgi:hypothetical protein